MKIKEKIIKIFESKGYIIENSQSDIIIDNAINSIDFIELIILLESEFSIVIPDEFLLIDEMNTIEKITGIIHSSLE